MQEAYEQKKKEDTDAAKKAAYDEAVAAGEEAFVVDAGGAKNSFDYSDRAAQTFNNPMRERGVATEPPPLLQFSATCTQWEIYDSYIDHYKREVSDQDSSKDKKQHGGGNGTTEGGGTSKAKEDDMVHSEKMGKALMILERMVNQNADDEIFQDFKYWEDASDAFREGEGSLLPLWRFVSERTKRKQVSM